MNPYVSVLIVIIVAVAISSLILVCAAVIGPKLRFPEKQEPFECGEEQLVSPKLRFSVKFYLVALVFVVFDIEAVFLYPWAVLFKELGLFGLIEILVFMAVLGFGLIYVWKKGALEWK
jgi:NADH-quinone oxidoreductase subunit A